MAVTARDTIQGALKLIGINDPIETMSPEDSADGLILLNDMVDMWSIEELNLYATENVSATFSGATATVGPAGTFNTARPIGINHAFYRKSGLDYSLQLATDAQYDAITDKTAAGDFPSVLWYANDVPLGVVTLWPVPGSITLFLNVDTQVTQFATLDTVYEFPPGYRMALKYCLTEHLAPIFQRPLPDLVAKNLAAARRVLKRSNVVVPTLDLGANPTGDGRRFNILSNTFR